MSRSKPRSASTDDQVRWHLRVGWWSLLAFLTLGLLLEGLHGFKVGWYLDVAHGTRRLLWTLAHAHGTLLSILNLLFAVTLSLGPETGEGSRRLASRSLVGATVLMPVGFFLGGLSTFAGDPGLAVVLAIPGGFLLFLAVLVVAVQISRSKKP